MHGGYTYVDLRDPRNGNSRVPRLKIRPLNKSQEQLNLGDSMPMH